MRIIQLEDFNRVEVGQGLHYLSVKVNGYEITLEPHLSVGYTVGLYHESDPLLAIRKLGIWKLNHPEYKDSAPDYIREQLVTQALGKAQDLYEQYVHGKPRKPVQ